MTNRINPAIFENDDYKDTRIVFDEAQGEAKGTILLLHGTAPMNIDGYVPIEELQEKIKAAAPEHYLCSTVYRDLAQALNRAGWNTVRYTRTGVYDSHVDFDEYKKTDLNNIMTQISSIFDAIPSDKPRVVFAWSGGSVHALQMPLAKADALILLGAIATKRTDLHNYTPMPEEQKKAVQAQLDEILEKKGSAERREMLNYDMPFGRFYDENDLDENWTYLSNYPELPTLILHGENDKEVDISQARLWKSNLPECNITAIFREKANHAWGCAANSPDTDDLAAVMDSWLDKTL
jgi:pimeloyl-ACP methyl ester carboxylesterase